MTDDDKLHKIESDQADMQKALKELSDEIPKVTFTEEDRQKLLEELSKPRDPMKPTGDPELDKILADMRRCRQCGRDRSDKVTKPCDNCRPPPDYPQMAPDGEIFVCGACGKTSKDLYDGGPSSGWDESCMMNAVLCHEDRKGGDWTAVKGYGPGGEEDETEEVEDWEEEQEED